MSDSDETFRKFRCIMAGRRASLKGCRSRCRHPSRLGLRTIADRTQSERIPGVRREPGDLRTRPKHEVDEVFIDQRDPCAS